MYNYLKTGTFHQLEQIKQNQLQEQQTNSPNNSVQTDINEHQEIDFQSLKQKRQKQEQQRKAQFVQQHMGMIFMGSTCCFIMTIVALGIAYYYFADSIKSFSTNSQEILNIDELTQLNAKQYFAHNPLYAGQIHFARIPVEYWQHRIQMVKSMGLNSLSVYIFWNYHEIQKGIYDFQTQNRNLTLFLQLAQKYNMTVLLRPGPYVCAQWDFGGLPARLLSIEGLEIRSSNSLFISQVKVYFQQLAKIIKNFIKNKNNPLKPILMIQVQNQPGLFTSQKLYIDKLKQLWDEINIGCPLYYDDAQESLKKFPMYWQNAILGVNGFYDEKGKLNQFSNGHFAMAGQVYSGWFTTWKATQQRVKALEEYRKYHFGQFATLLQEKSSFSMYMAHGGTNFGLTAGYNMITSYDYLAPINEHGSPRQLYYWFRYFMKNLTATQLLSIPEQIQTMKLTLGSPTPISSLFDNLPVVFSFQKATANPLLFQSKQLQMFKQGLVLYETQLQGPFNYKISLIVNDIGYIYLDGFFLKKLQRSDNISQTKVHQLTIKCQNKTCKFQILVEAMGHINVRQQMKTDRKGLIKFQILNKNEKLKINDQFIWSYYKFDLTNELSWKNTQKCQKSPCLYSIQKQIQQPMDTYINFKDLKKGYIWVNGHNLGRYWNVGPQNKLYCPGVWLKKGKNKILILDMLQSNLNTTLKGERTLN